MPANDIELKVGADTVASRQSAPVSVVSATDILPPTAADSMAVDTIVHMPLRRLERVDTMFISASDFPKAAMDTTYLDSCLQDELVVAPAELTEPPHIPVSAEEAVYDSLFAKLTSVSDTTVNYSTKPKISIKEVYAGFEGKTVSPVLQSQIWFAPLMFALFFGFGLVFALRSKSLSRDFKELFSLKVSKEAVASTGEQLAQYRFALLVTGSVSLSVFTLQSFLHYYPHLKPTSFLLATGACCLLTAAFVFLKQVLAAVMGFVFVGTTEKKHWTHAFNLTVGGVGLVLFPIVLCVAYGPQQLFGIQGTALADSLIRFGLIVPILGEFVMLIYVLHRFFKYRFSILYLFLYLCTLEFLPLAALLAGYYNAIATV